MVEPYVSNSEDVVSFRTFCANQQNELGQLQTEPIAGSLMAMMELIKTGLGEYTSQATNTPAISKPSNDTEPNLILQPQVSPVQAKEFLELIDDIMAAERQRADEIAAGDT